MLVLQGIKKADKGIRTLDLRITNAPLYQLSYIGMGYSLRLYNKKIEEKYSCSIITKLIRHFKDLLTNKIKIFFI